MSVDGHRFRRPAICAHDPFLCFRVPGVFRGGSHCDDLACRIQESHARDDYGTRGLGRGAGMNSLSRRKLITTGLAASAGASGLAVATNLAHRYGLIPPDYGGLYGAGETLTYAAQRLLTRHSLAREFPR